MLVLQRKAGQSIIIGDIASGDAVVVSVQSLTERSVKISIQAARDIPIVRSELLTPMQRSTMENFGFTLDIETK